MKTAKESLKDFLKKCKCYSIQSGDPEQSYRLNESDLLQLLNDHASQFHPGNGENKPTDQDIKNAANDYINDLDTRGLDKPALHFIAYQQGAKDMRDNNIYIAPKEPFQVDNFNQKRLLDSMNAPLPKAEELLGSVIPNSRITDNYVHSESLTREQYLNLEKEELVTMLMNCRALLGEKIPDVQTYTTTDNSTIQDSRRETKTLTLKEANEIINREHPNEPYGKSTEADEWISVKEKERLPEKLKTVIFCTEMGYVTQGYLTGMKTKDGLDMWMETYVGNEYHNVILWQPLPKAPQK